MAGTLTRELWRETFVSALRRPSAHTRPSGKEATLPTAARSCVSTSPPHCVVATGDSPVADQQRQRSPTCDATRRPPQEAGEEAEALSAPVPPRARGSAEYYTRY